MATNVDSAYWTFFFSLQYCIFMEVYVRRIAGSPSEGWNKITNRSILNISNRKLSPYSGLLINTISCLWPAIWMHAFLYQWNLEELILSCDRIHRMVMAPRCGNSTIHPNHRVPVKGLLFHQCLQARLGARDKANLQHHWGTPENSKKGHCCCPGSKPESSPLKGGGGGVTTAQVQQAAAATLLTL